MKGDERAEEAAKVFLDVALLLSGASMGAVIAGQPGQHRTLQRSTRSHKTVAAGSSEPVVDARAADMPFARVERIWSALEDADEKIDRGHELLSDATAIGAGPADDGQRIFWHLALRHDQRLLGFTTLAFCAGEGPSPQVRPVIVALAAQLGYTLGTLAASFALGVPASGQLAHLEQWVTANNAMQEAIVGLAGVDDTQPLLAAMLADTLRLAGTGDGAVALLEGEPGSQWAHIIVLLENGEVVPSSVKRQKAMERIPLHLALQRFAQRLSVAPDGLSRKADDPAMDRNTREYVRAQGVQNVHAMALRQGDKMIGWLGIGYRDEVPIGTERIGMLRVLASHMSVAVELARLANQAKLASAASRAAESTQTRLESVTTANRILAGAIDVLARSPQLDSVLNYSLRSICESMASSDCHGQLWLVDVERGVQRLHLLFEDGRLASADETAGLNASLDQPIDWDLYRQGPSSDCPLVLSPARLPSDIRQRLNERGIEHVLSLRMFVADSPVGAFLIGLPAQPQMPAPDNVALALALTQQATLALQMTRLADEGRRLAIANERETAAQARAGELARANRTLKRSLDLPTDQFDLDQTLGHMLRLISEHIDCRASTLCMRSIADETFRPKLEFHDNVVRPLAANDKGMLPSPEPDSQLWEIVVEQGRSFVFDPRRPTHGDGGLREWCDRLGIRSLLALPMVEVGRVTGCFLFHFPHLKEYDAEQLELIQTLSHQAAVVVQLGRLHRAEQAKGQREATLAERARIAREFHDTLAQGLTGILMHLRASLRTTDEAEGRAYVESAIDAAKTAVVDVRRSLQALRSMALERSDFVSALKAVLDSIFAGSRVAVELTVVDPVDGITYATAAELLRIAQESATNALKHASATRFLARLAVEDGTITLMLEDDGVGFDAFRDHEGFGLIGIRERAVRIGASLRVESGRDGGTRIVVSAAAERQAEDPSNRQDESRLVTAPGV